MSGFSPTWTSKGSDKLRALQVTKILMNTLKRLLLSFDLSDENNQSFLISTIASTIYTHFTPNKDLKIEEQYSMLLEFLGWKTMAFERQKDIILVKLGANRYLSSNTKDQSYLILISGIISALGYYIYESNVVLEEVPSQFDSKQIEIILRKIDEDIPTEGELSDKITTTIPSKKSETTTYRTKEPKTEKEQTEETITEKDLRVNIDLSLENAFNPFLEGYPISKVLPILHKVLAEIVTTYFREIEGIQVQKAKKEFTEMHILYLIEFILLNAKDTNQSISEIAKMVGEYTIKALGSQTGDNLSDYLPKEITSTISRRVSYVEFPARAYCFLRAGEKCIAGKRDLCDFILCMWEGMLNVLKEEKGFTLGERIPATRRGKFCLAEFLKGN